MENEREKSQSLPLHSHHLADLRRSGLSDDIIRQAGIFSVNEAEGRDLLNRKTLRGGGYAIPYFDSTGRNLILQKNGRPYVSIKLDHPLKDKRGKARKYLKPTNEPNYLYFPPTISKLGKNPDQQVLFTEGEKKALKAVQEGFTCIALSGVWGFKTRKGQKAGRSFPLAQLDEIPMSQREVSITFDSDLSINPKVQQAEKAFAGYARNRGAIVHLVRLPNGPNGTKVGLDDFLVKEGAAAFEALMQQAQRQEEAAESSSTPPSRMIHPADVAHEFLSARGLNTHEGMGLRNYREEWYHYDRGVFRPLPLYDLKAQVVGYLQTSTAPEKATHIFANNVLLNLHALCVIPSSVALPAQQTDTGWISTPNSLVLENGILNLEQLIQGHSVSVLSPLAPTFITTVGLTFAFDQDAKCLHWLDFLNQILPDPESQLLLQELFGYCLTYDTSLQKFFLFEGRGANGKGVVLRILTRLLGEPNVSSLPLELFGASHDLIVTLGKLVNMTSEIGDLAKVAEGLLKQFTGDDLMHFNPKHRHPFSAKPTAKLIIATNVRPPFRDRSEGVWRRLIVLPFPVSIPPESQNPHLTEKLATELPGILNWAIAGAYSLRQRGFFLEPSAGIAAREQFQREANPARLFLEEHCETEQTSDVPTILLYRAYAEWCKASGYRPLNETHFGREVHAHFPHVTRARFQAQDDGSRPWGYRGLKFLGPLLSG